MSWQVVAFTALALVLLGGFAWYERSRPPARLVALVAALAALAVAGRLVLAPVPNVVATTDIALLTGYALGPAPGFAVGALAAPISNIWLGQGPWTVWQMAGWGLAGLAGAWLAIVSRRSLGRFGLAAACGMAGLAYGALLDLSLMVTYGGEQSLDRYLALSGRGLPFNIAHAIGNVGFALVAGPALVRMISRYRTRLEFTWHPAGALPLVLLALIIVRPGFDPPAADAERSMRAAGVVRPAETWLVDQQNADGGYAASPDFDSNPAMTGWAMLGLEAAGRNPLDVKKQGRTPVSYLRGQVDHLRSTNDLERTILALEGAGVSSRDFAGADLVAELRSRRARDGSVDGQVNLTAFFALAMRAAGSDAGELARPARWLRAAQNGDGGWGFAPGSPSDPDSTGAALQALAAANAAGTAADLGARWLRHEQRPSGGWGLNTTGVVNAQSTAWAVQGLVAVGSKGAALRAGLAYLERLQAADGHYRYSSSTDQTPIWVTAQSLLAIARKPLPLATVQRRARPARAGEDEGRGSSAAADASPPAPPEAGGAGPSAQARGEATPGRSSSADRGASSPKQTRGESPAATDRADEGRVEGTPAAAIAAGEPAPAPAQVAADQEGGGSAAAYTAADVAVLVALGGGLWWLRRRVRSQSPAGEAEVRRR